MTFAARDVGGVSLRLSPAAGLQIGFWALAALALVIGQGTLIHYAFAPLSLMVGFILFRRYQVSFVSFAMWLWMLAPFVRRVVDWQTDYHQLSPVLTAPLLVSCLGFLTIFRISRHLQESRYAPMSIVFLVLVLGLLIGIVTAGAFAAIYAFLTWAAPLAVAFVILARPDDAAGYGRALFNALIWGGVAMGAYGIYQYFYAPPWDTTWMVASGMLSIGNPEPGEIRVFSTMNSPGPLAAMLTASLVALVAKGGILRWLSTVPVATSLLLSLVRSAWGALIVSLAVIALAGRGKARIRLLFAGLIAAIVLAPALGALPFAGTIADRFGTIANLEEDESFQDRFGFISAVLEETIVNPLGHGLGATGLATRLTNSEGDLTSYGIFDSGILDLFFTFGWLGLAVVGALVVIVGRAVRQGRHTSDGIGAIAIATGTLSQMVFANFMLSGPGMLVLPFLALAMVQPHPRTQPAEPPPVPN